MELPIIVRPVAGRRDRDEFISLPFRLYAGEPHWVAPLVSEIKEKLDRSRHPFFSHSEAEFFLARRGGRVAGRIAALVNTRHNAFHNERAAGFGLVEFERDPAVAAVLLQAAARWGRDRGMEVLRGPFNFSTNEECATLTEGFDRPPVIMMPYNPPWHAEILAGCGLRPAKTLLSYLLDDSADFSRVRRASARILKRNRSISIRCIDRHALDREIDRAFRIYNEAWEKNWGFVPMTEAEFRWHARKLKPALVPELALFAAVDGQDAAFALSLPDLNRALAPARGRLLPFGLIKYLWHRRRVDGLRVITLGVRKEFRGLGLDGLMVQQIVAAGMNLGYRWADLGWILEDNMPIRRVVERLGARPYKKYTIWEAPIGEIAA